MKHYSLRTVCMLLISAFILASCSSSDNTIVIEDAPVASQENDTTRQQTQPAGPFRQLTLGENQAIRTLDPLFVQNDASVRALQLVYEGLVRYNEQGDIEPAIAKEWSATNGDRTYRFTLNNDLFYHDSNIFANGRGRRLVATDVKKAFQRMAGTDVPDRAAQLFMDIEGFEPYFREQHQVLMSGERQLNGISGIRTPNDSTVVFSLADPDEQFLHKLAHPYAVIYPPESVTSGSFRSVGTGPFRLSQQRSDSMHIFSRFDNYRTDNQQTVNRIDIVTTNNEQALLNAMNRGDIQFIPELGPGQMRIATDSSGAIASSLQPNYTLYTERGSSGYHIRYNEGADISRDAAVAALFTARGGTYFAGLSRNYVQLMWNFSETTGTAVPDSLQSTYTDNPYVRRFYSELSGRLSGSNITFSMSETRVRNRNTPLYISSYLPVQPSAMRTPPTQSLVTIAVQPLGLAHNNVENIKFNELPWWIDLRDVSVPSQNNR